MLALLLKVIFPATVTCMLAILPQIFHLKCPFAAADYEHAASCQYFCWLLPLLTRTARPPCYL